MPCVGVGNNIYEENCNAILRPPVTVHSTAPRQQHTVFFPPTSCKRADVTWAKLGDLWRGIALDWCCFSIQTLRLNGSKRRSAHLRNQQPVLHNNTNKSHHLLKRLISRLRLENKSINSSPPSSQSRRTHLGLSKPAACLHEQPSLTTADNHPARPLAN